MSVPSIVLCFLSDAASADEVAGSGDVVFKVVLVAVILLWLIVVAKFLRGPEALEEVVLSKPLAYVVVTAPVGLGVAGLFYEAAALGQMGLFFGAVFLGMFCLLVHVQLAKSKRTDVHVERIGGAVDRVMDMLPRALMSASVHKIATVDEVFATLNRARNKATCIRLMQLRDSPPVETEVDGSIRQDANGRPIYHNKQEPSIRWYEGMRDWCVQEGHQAERITNVDSPGMRSYADFVDADIPTGWATIRIDRGRPLPFMNLCIFDSDRVLLTVEIGGAHAYKTMTGLWIEDEGVVSWLLMNYYEKLKNQAIPG